MAETPQEYVKRILGNLNGREPMEVLASTPTKLAELARGRANGEFTKSPAPGKWTVTEILAHLADVEIAVGYRLRCILGNNGAQIQSFDQEAWAESSQYKKIPVAQSLEHHRALRQSNLALLKSLKPGQWENYGVHNERGKESVSRIVQVTAGHDLNHIRQIETAFSQKS